MALLLTLQGQIRKLIFSDDLNYITSIWALIRVGAIFRTLPCLNPDLQHNFSLPASYIFWRFIEAVGTPVFFSVFFNLRQTQNTLHKFGYFWKRRHIDPNHLLQSLERIAQNKIRPS